MSDPRKAVVEAAQREIGRGDVPKYWASCMVKPPYPKHWCGGMALYCLHEANLAVNVPWKIARGFCEVQGLKRTKSPLPGDIAYTDAPWQHHAVVESFDGKTLVTIDGNQGEPQPVKRKVRPMPESGMVFYSIQKFIDGHDAPAPAPAPVPKIIPPYEPPPELIYGIDVSHHQNPAAINWAQLAKTCKFAIARATYGVRPDKTFAEHIERARDVGLVLGAYHFFRPQESVADQLSAFMLAADVVGMGPGWIAPALDIERNEEFDGPLTPERYAKAELICDDWQRQYGGAMVYTNPDSWRAIGSPRWIEEHSLWISHFGVAKPATPHGLPWSIWQHRVAPLPGVINAKIDQNAAKSLPILQALDVQPLPIEVDWEELRRDRDRMIAEQD